MSPSAGSNCSLEGNFSLAATWDIISIFRNNIIPPTKKESWQSKMVASISSLKHQIDKVHVLLCFKKFQLF